jgi:hypothetical protein
MITRRVPTAWNKLNVLLNIKLFQMLELRGLEPHRGTAKHLVCHGCAKLVSTTTMVIMLPNTCGVAHQQKHEREPQTVYSTDALTLLFMNVNVVKQLNIGEDDAPAARCDMVVEFRWKPSTNDAPI